MAKYKKMPFVIEAVQWRGTPTFGAILDLAEDSKRIVVRENEKLMIRTLEGWMCATPGDWVIKGVQGELYSCKPDIFEATYEKAGD